MLAVAAAAAFRGALGVDGTKAFGGGARALAVRQISSSGGLLAVLHFHRIVLRLTVVRTVHFTAAAVGRLITGAADCMTSHWLRRLLSCTGLLFFRGLCQESFLHLRRPLHSFQWQGAVRLQASHTTAVAAPLRDHVGVNGRLF